MFMFVSVLFEFPLFSIIFLLSCHVCFKQAPQTHPVRYEASSPPCESPHHFSLNVSPLFHSLTKHAEFNCSTVKASGASRSSQVSKALKHTKDRRNNRGKLRGENIGVRGTDSDRYRVHCCNIKHKSWELKLR